MSHCPVVGAFLSVRFRTFPQETTANTGNGREFWVNDMKPEITGLWPNCWRRGSESNRRIKVLQTLALPLGYRALSRLGLLAR